MCFRNGVPFVSFCAVCVVTACDNLPVYIHIVLAESKCSITDSIKSEYPFVNGVNENFE
jgi:hypothetical protein